MITIELEIDGLENNELNIPNLIADLCELIALHNGSGEVLSITDSDGLELYDWQNSIISEPTNDSIFSKYHQVRKINSRILEQLSNDESVSADIIRASIGDYHE